MQNLFSNPGKKIKTTAFVFFVLAAAGGVISFFALWDWDELTAFLILVGGVLGGWLLALPLYAFGEMAENIQKIESNTHNPDAPAESAVQRAASDSRRKQLEELRAQDLISEEEFQQALNQHEEEAQ